MAYNSEIAERIRDALAHEPDVVERKMFGGLAFLIRGNMTVVASSKGGLMIRADPTTSAHLVQTTSAEFAEMSGRRRRPVRYPHLPIAVKNPARSAASSP